MRACNAPTGREDADYSQPVLCARVLAAERCRRREDAPDSTAQRLRPEPPIDEDVPGEGKEGGEDGGGQPSKVGAAVVALTTGGREALEEGFEEVRPRGGAKQSMSSCAREAQEGSGGLGKAREGSGGLGKAQEGSGRLTPPKMEMSCTSSEDEYLNALARGWRHASPLRRPSYTCAR